MIPEARPGDLIGRPVIIGIAIITTQMVMDFRRRHIVEITEAGSAALRQAQRARQAIEDSVQGALDSEERVTLRRLLTKAIEG